MSIADKLTTIANNTRKVYRTGYQKGEEIGFQSGFRAGEYTEYMNLWNNIQDSGNQTDYQFTFGGLGWNDDTFKPKHDIKPTNGRFMFVNSRITNLTKLLENQKVVLDTSKCIACDSMFYLSFVTNINLNLSSAKNLDSLCNSAIYLETVSLIISNSGTQTFNNSFYQTINLKNITIEGVIGRSIDFSYSPLSANSIINIMTHLSDSSENMLVTFKNAAVNKAFMGPSGNMSDVWLNLIAAKPNWTIILI